MRSPLTRGPSQCLPNITTLLASPLLVWLIIVTMASSCEAINANDRLLRITYAIKDNHTHQIPSDQSLKLNMSETHDIQLLLSFQRELLPQPLSKWVAIKFRCLTLLPQFPILFLANETLLINRGWLERGNFTYNASLKLEADYIGRAILEPYEIIYSNWWDLSDPTSNKTQLLDRDQLSVIVLEKKTILYTLFIVTVSLLVVIIYINLGAQLDLKNLRRILKRPRSIVLGFLISTLVMPMVSFLIGWQMLSNQVLYRIGFFMFAAGPAALASTPWSELLGGDKELSMSLQVLSTLAGFLVMPGLSYIMELLLGSTMASGLNDNRDGELLLSSHPIRVPYARLVELLTILISSLAIGYRVAGANERLKKLMTRVYRPLIFGMLFFIIVTSTFIYWHIYRMFDWWITLTAAFIIATSLLTSFLLALLSTWNASHALTIAISSIYKNEGIAFTVFAFAFTAPDNTVAYVPCLTQILITSLSFCLIRTSIQIRKSNCLQRGRKIVVRPAAPADSNHDPQPPPSRQEPDREAGRPSEQEQFIPVNVHEETAGAPSGADQHQDANSNSNINDNTTQAC